jgi:predicted dehydrogenase
VTPIPPGPPARRRQDEAVRIAVVGVGSMGASHVRVYDDLKGAEVIAVVDPDVGRAAEVAERCGATAVATLDELEGHVDAASVVVPSALHADVACRLLELGIDCLVEKPLATNVVDGRRIASAADASGQAVLVGHVERFNPAVEQLASILEGAPPVLAVEARRMSAVSSRITDVDVISDLMVHDLDIVVGLLGDDVVDITARGVAVGSAGAGAGGDDYVTALLTFGGGALVSLTASRITQQQVRSLQVTTAERLYAVDYSAQALDIYRQGRLGGIGDEQVEPGRYLLDVGTERVFVRRSEPLVSELRHFLDVVRRREPARVDAAAGLRVLELTERIRGAVRGEIRA